MHSERTPEELSEVYHVLRAARRRYVIRLLLESDEETLSVRTLARQIAALEEDVPRERATGEPYRNVYNALSQTHLSTLSEAELIIYDPDRQTVSVGPHFQIGVLFTVLNQATYQTLQGEEFGSLGGIGLTESDRGSELR
jgi:DNA-binding transcriptional ArsR family regulator